MYICLHKKCSHPNLKSEMAFVYVAKLLRTVGTWNVSHALRSCKSIIIYLLLFIHSIINNTIQLVGHTVTVSYYCNIIISKARLNSVNRAFVHFVISAGRCSVIAQNWKSEIASLKNSRKLDGRTTNFVYKLYCVLLQIYRRVSTIDFAKYLFLSCVAYFFFIISILKTQSSFGHNDSAKKCFNRTGFARRVK